MLDAQIDQRSHVKRFLSYLGLEPSSQDLHFLNQLVNAHQRKVRWENLTKMIDAERGEKTREFLPSIETHIDRMTKQGTGGTCWTLAIGFHWLLERLGYDVRYVYMDSGHLCLRVDLDQPYYVDVGYCAPLFQAYPMLESFTVQDEREVFQYIVEGDKITVIREPGPTKTLNPEPVTLEDMRPLIIRANQWETAAPLQKMLVFGYVDGVPTSLTNNVMKQYYPDQKVELELTEEEIHELIRDKFLIDPDLYREAAAIYKRRQQA